MCVSYLSIQGLLLCKCLDDYGDWCADVRPCFI